MRGGEERGCCSAKQLLSGTAQRCHVPDRPPVVPSCCPCCVPLLQLRTEAHHPTSPPAASGPSPVHQSIFSPHLTSLPTAAPLLSHHRTSDTFPCSCTLPPPFLSPLSALHRCSSAPLPPSASPPCASPPRGRSSPSTAAPPQQLSVAPSTVKVSSTLFSLSPLLPPPNDVAALPLLPLPLVRTSLATASTSSSPLRLRAPSALTITPHAHRKQPPPPDTTALALSPSVACPAIGLIDWLSPLTRFLLFTHSASSIL